MKSILYVGASLMIGASIYGFVDYKQTHNKKGFTEMYQEGKHESAPAVEPVAVTEEKKVAEPAIPVVTKNKKPVFKKTVLKEEIPVVKQISEDEEIDNKGTKSIGESKVDVKTSPVATIKKTKKKKINHRIFSRAPLREEIEEPAIDTVKKN